VRIIATTNRDLELAVRSGDFREDLYYRLNVFPIYNPALHERADDIPLLTEAFLRRLSRKLGLPVPKVSATLLKALCQHPWPGNVRELQNVLERGVIIAADGKELTPRLLGLESEPEPIAVEREGEPADLMAASALARSINPEEVASGESKGRYRVEVPAEDESIPRLEEVERSHILQTLEATDGNRTHAARILDISIRALRNKIRQYKDEGLTVPEYSGRGWRGDSAAAGASR
jgi:DNA-binding NtrC family response regulator